MTKAIILVIEDEVNILNNICTILELSNYECIKAINGIDALEKLKIVHPNLILCDVMMPEMDGFGVIKNIQNQEQLKHIPFCFLSARADVIDIDYGLSIGAKGYITKPFLAKDLLQTVNSLLG